MFDDLFIGNEEWVLYVINAWLIHDLHYVYIVEAFLNYSDKLIINLSVHFLGCR